MKRISIYLSAIILLTFSACSFHFPYGWMDDYDTYRVILQVEPDDAHVLVNGRFIGEAYEFSSDKTALRLSSRNFEVIVKKKGYIEETIDLGNYLPGRVKINMKLKQDTTPVPEALTEKKVLKSVKPEHVAKVAPVKAPVAEPAPEPAVKVINLKLEITPPEATIYLDGKFFGISPDNGKIDNIKLKAGKHVLEVLKPGYKSFKKELNAGTKDLLLKIVLKKEK